MEHQRRGVLAWLRAAVSIRWRHEWLSLGVVGLTVLALECFGRLHQSEFLDALGVGILVAVVANCVAWHRRRNLRWTNWLWERIQTVPARFEGLTFDWGVDLRRQPPVPRAVPPALLMVPLLLALLIVFTVGWIELLDFPARALVAPISYTAYLVGLTLLWAALLFVILAMAFVPPWALTELVAGYSACSQRQLERMTWIITLSYWGILLVSGVFAPAWLATLLIAVTSVIAVVLPYLPPIRRLDYLWCPKNGSEVRTLTGQTCSILFRQTQILIPLLLVLVAVGPDSVDQPGFALGSPLSYFLGRVTAWLSACGLLIFIGVVGGHAYFKRWSDPESPAPTSLHISGTSDRAQQIRIRLRLADRGWRIHFAPRPPQPTDVRISLVSEADDITYSSERHLRVFRVTEADLDDNGLLDRIGRRDEIQRRRLLIGGLRTVFRDTDRRYLRKIRGVIVAPHLWFVEGLWRDAEEGEQILELIPPLFRSVMPRQARNHFFLVCQALQIDLVYVEKGVKFRELRRVLRIMFERYDIDAGQQPLGEVHFSGLPKIRVVIHEYSLTKPLLKTGYPEPDYKDFSRARILHVFRDRGDEDDIQPPAPVGSDWLLSPVG